ncbi:MAG: hypothetical protein ABW032_01395 [Burkholderiaceae bacterium]
MSLDERLPSRAAPAPRPLTVPADFDRALSARTSVKRPSPSRSVSGALPRAYVDALIQSGFVIKGKDVQAYYTNLKNNRGIRYDQLIRKFVETNPFGVTELEAHVMFGYTTKLFYAKLNKAVRDGLPSAKCELVRLLKSGTAKMPKANPRQFRGLLNPSEEVRNRYRNAKPGDVVVFNGFSSSSDNPTAEFWDIADIRFTTDDSEARDVSALSLPVQFPGKIPGLASDQESLFLLNAKFRVESNDGRDLVMRQII